MVQEVEKLEKQSAFYVTTAINNNSLINGN